MIDFSKRSVLMAITIVANAGVVFAGDFPMAVSPSSSGEGFTLIPATGIVSRTGKKTTLVKINNSCFGTNLRGVSNPLAPNSSIEANIVLSVGGKDYPLQVEYPAELVTKNGMVAKNVEPILQSKVKIPGGGKGAIYGNTVHLQTSIPSSVQIDDKGNVAFKDLGEVFIKSYTFTQVVQDCKRVDVYGEYGYSSYTPTYPCGVYMGTNGPLTATIGGIVVAPDKSSVDINISFPGQTGFCGGYWSPLMVFFDSSRPEFTNSSDFPLNPTGKTMWPEAKSPGWFLALDRDGNGKIDQKNELFGDTANVDNGFEVLRKLDSNKDQQIDKSDKTFRELVLWNDKNGDGISQPEEMVPAAKKLYKISLQYKSNMVEPLGKYAEAREKSLFWYRKNGKNQSGEIVDIWLAPLDRKLSQK